MPLTFYSLLPLVREFLPHMLEQGDGAILTAQGASTVHGLRNMSGPGPAQAAQRNYLQSLRAEVADKGVYVGMRSVWRPRGNRILGTAAPSRRSRASGSTPG